MRLIDADEAKKLERMVALKPSERALFRLMLDRMPTYEPPNAPLTLEELREMDGEPVWVRNHCSGACICRVISLSDENFTHFSDGGLCENKSYRTYWTAYRRKPEEGEA